MVPGKLFWPFWPSNWPYDVIGLSLEPQKSTSRLLFDRSFRWERKKDGSGFRPQLVIFIYQSILDTHNYPMFLDPLENK